ncbi:CHAT domain-containing protein [Leptolyngbya sp. KIOST-1]|uniref:CHAT domain-containing protein n=1 Tax=Leptolyngbya sp. KIOST-1 TaxID=1229172 RepID=UPI00068B8FEC|nr:CHAT domain-containing protein [Leptolyngbya sp. KIOST-1]
MLHRLWQWLRRRWRRWFAPPAPPAPPPLPPLDDTGYEFLWMQAMDGLAAGWGEAQVLAHLGDRVYDRRFADWLRRFGYTRLLRSPEPNRELAGRMVRLGEMGCGELGVLAGAIGRELLRDKTPDGEKPLSDQAVIAQSSANGPRSVENAPTGAEQTAEKLVKKAIQTYQNGDIAGAMTAIEHTTQAFPNYYQAWGVKGVLMSAAGDIKGSIICYDAALALNPSDHNALSNKGNALTALGQHEAAITCYDGALALNPNRHDTLSNKAIALHALGRYEAMIVCLDAALALKADDHEALSKKGNALYALGQYEKAINCCNAALNLKPDAYETLYNKGVALCDLGRLEGSLARLSEGIACYDAALTINPDLYQALNNKGNSLLYFFQYETAITCCDAALAIKPDYHEAWINRGSAAGASERCHTSVRLTLPATLQDPALDQRGYPGQIAAYQMGLRQVNPLLDPLGWGELHRVMGRAHFFHGRFTEQANHFFRQAIGEYSQALATLTAAAFPREHLQVLQDAIRAHLGLGDAAQAARLREQGLAVFRTLLNSQTSPRQREQLELQFSGFSQLAVDLLVQQGSTAAALEAADRYKNRTLTWLLATWQDTVPSPSAAEIAALAHGSTALVQWHLSPDALTRFVVLPGHPEPSITASVQTSQKLETWLKAWDADYTDYRAKGKTVDAWQRQQHPWRQNVPGRLATLREILDIPALEQTLTQAGITHLRLVPHRHLHRLPLPSLFTPPFTITHLPSAQVGLALGQRAPFWPVTPQTPLLSIEEPANAELAPLVFAEIESALIAQGFAQATRIAADEATQARVTAALEAGAPLTHLTGHGFFDDRQPRQSALALAGTDQLTVETIRSLKLGGCGLVSLAACETAVTGTETIQAEYVGLASAFLKAGASAVLSTLWTVESVSNAWLMVYFYEQLLAGASPAVALHRAQTWLRGVTYADLATWLQTHLTADLKAADGSVYDALAIEIQELQTNADRVGLKQDPYSDPYFWAAFILSGFCDESH